MTQDADYRALLQQVKRAETAESEVHRLRAAILDIDAHAHALETDEDGFNAGGYMISMGSLHRALGLLGHTAAKPREHAVALDYAHGMDCEECGKMAEIVLDAVASARTKSARIDGLEAGGTP